MKDLLLRLEAALAPDRADDWRGFWPLLAALIGVGVAVRLGRVPVVWDYWALDYISYTYEHYDALGTGVPWLKLVGMHPGQYALGMALLLRLGAPLGLLFALPVLASTVASAVGAVWVRKLTSSWPGLLFAGAIAVSPYQAHYGMELNNYPLFGMAGALLLVLYWSCWQDPSRGRLVGLGVAVCAALHTHFFLVPVLVLLAVALVATKRWRALAAMGIGLVPALPVLIHAAVLPTQTDTYTGEVPVGWILVHETTAAWVGRFGSPRSLAAMLAASGVGAVMALARPATRGPAVLLLGTIACLTTVYYVGFVTGAARIFQTPYWVLPSWCALALMALGFAGARWYAFPAFAVALLLWLPPAATRALLPRSQSEAPVGEWSDGAARWTSAPKDGSALAAYIDESFGPGDVVMVMWDAPYINDQPHRHDPHYDAFPPMQVGPWDPESVNTGFGYRFRGGTAYFFNRVLMREGDDEISLHDSVERWIREGRTLHIVVTSVDPELPLPDARRLREWVDQCGGQWSDRRLETSRLIVIEPPP